MTQELGTAQGRIAIDVADLQRIQALSQQIGQQVARNLGQINASAQQAQAGIENLGKSSDDLQASLNGVLKVIGFGGGIFGLLKAGQAVYELGRAGAAAERTKESFDDLARGSGQSGAAILDALRKASRGTISDSNLILDANKSMLLGVASSAGQMTQLLEIARVRGQATGRSTGEAFQRIVDGIGKLEPEMLDELGIAINLTQVFDDYGKSVGKSADELSQSEKRNAAFNAVVASSQGVLRGAGDKIDETAEAFDRLSASIDNAKEKLAKGFAPTAGGVADFLAKAVDAYAQQVEIATGPNRPGLFQPITAGYIKKVQAQQLSNAPMPSPALVGDRIDETRTGPPGFTAKQTEAITEWARSVQQIEREAGQQRLRVTQQYEQQRTQAVAQYEQSLVREAQDYARQRARAEANLNKEIAAVGIEATKREQKASADLAKNIAKANIDNARQQALEIAASDKQQAKAIADTEQRIAQEREESAKRLKEIDDDYNKERERALRDHNDALASAAGELDARAVAQEQLRYARQAADAAADHADTVSKEKAQLEDRTAQEQAALAESLAEQQAALTERLDQERAALAERNLAAVEANNEQLAEARQADAERIAELKANFAEQQKQEDEDRAVRLARMAEDHAAQLAQMDAAQVERLKQIDQQATDERTKLDENFQAQLDQLGLHNTAWLKAQKKQQKDALDAFNDWWNSITTTIATTPIVAPTIVQQTPTGGTNGGTGGGTNSPTPTNDLTQFISDFQTWFANLVTTLATAQTNMPQYVKDSGVKDSSVKQMSRRTSIQALNLASQSFGGPPVVTQGRSGRSLSIGDISFQIYAAPGMSVQQIGDVVEERMLDVFERLAR